MPAPLIRPARPDEAARLSALALASKAHWGYDAEFMAACLPMLTLSAEEIAAGGVFVAERQGRPVAFYGLALADGADDAPPEPEIAYFFVEPQSIGQGIGAALWAHLEAEAARRGWPRVRIESDPDAEAFYLRMGARRIGEAHAGVGGRALPLLELRLAGQDG